MNGACFELKGSAFTLTVLQLFNSNLECLEQDLNEKVKMAPGFFNHTPVVVDLHQLVDSQEAVDFKALKKIICEHKMIPVGVKGADSNHKAIIEEAGLALLAEAKHSTQDKSSESKPVTKTKEPIEVKKEIVEKTVEVAQQSLVIKQTVRSGQQYYAANGDLIILGSVSAGAEVLADGNIHIYGSLRGKAMAGIKGNQQAQIFCHNLQSELISIAGIYLLCDDIPQIHLGNPSHIQLQEEKLKFNQLIT